MISLAACLFYNFDAPDAYRSIKSKRTKSVYPAGIPDVVMVIVSSLQFCMDMFTVACPFRKD
jgi:hypothetical protein